MVVVAVEGTVAAVDTAEGAVVVVADLDCTAGLAALKDNPT